MELNLTIQILLFEDRVHTNVRGVHFRNLMFLEQQGETILVGAALVGDDGKVLHSPLGCSLDKVLGDTAEAETSSDNPCTIKNIMSSL